MKNDDYTAEMSIQDFLEYCYYRAIHYQVTIRMRPCQKTRSLYPKKNYDSTGIDFPGAEPVYGWDAYTEHF